jgi:hypothetical protein
MQWPQINELETCGMQEERCAASITHAAQLGHRVRICRRMGFPRSYCQHRLHRSYTHIQLRPCHTKRLSYSTKGPGSSSTDRIQPLRSMLVKIRSATVTPRVVGPLEDDHDDLREATTAAATHEGSRTAGGRPRPP